MALAVKRIVASGRALAAIVLAIALVRVLFLRAFGAVTGIALFRKNYDPDRLPPVDRAERDQLTSFSGCFACGRCDAGEGERIRQAAGGYQGIMSFVLAASRSMPDYDAASLALEVVPDSVLKEKDAICPAHVPISALARFVRAKADDVARVT